jgi:DNA/RNA endonuclease YhcR with UshA esterase domain
MRASITAAAVLFALLASSAGAQETKQYSALEAAKHIDERATVTDKVTGVYQSKAGYILLNMGGHYPNQAFTAFISSESGDEFQRAKELDGHTVSVTGQITSYKGKPEITVDTLSQVQKKE